MRRRWHCGDPANHVVLSMAADGTEYYSTLRVNINSIPAELTTAGIPWKYYCVELDLGRPRVHQRPVRFDQRDRGHQCDHQ